MNSLKETIIMQDRGMVYVSAIHEYLLKQQDEDMKKSLDSKKKPAIHPSGLSNSCLRNLYYQYLRMPQKPQTIKSIKRCEVGNDMHDRYHEYAKKAGILVACEKKLKNKEYRISARLDQLVLLDKLRVIELKSMEDSKYKKLMAPHKSHIYQTNIYIWLLNTMFSEKRKDKIFKDYEKYFPVEDYSIIIENINNQDTTEFPGKYDSILMEEILKIIKTILEYADKKEIPPITSSIENCMYCGDREICKNIASPIKPEDEKFSEIEDF